MKWSDFTFSSSQPQLQTSLKGLTDPFKVGIKASKAKEH